MESEKLLERFNELIEEHELSESLPWGDYDGTEIISSELGEFKYVLSNKRLSNGDHDTSQTVLHFKEHNVYLSISGYYDSHNGSNFDSESWFIVYPVEVTYIEYTTKKP